MTDAIVPTSTVSAAVGQPPPAFIQTNLISDGSVPAMFTDPNLINPWGISYGPSTNFWISNQVTGVSSVDSVVGQSTTAPVNLTLNVIPAVKTPSPTGQVFNPFPDAFKLSNGAAATFLFASTTGSITGWTPDLGTNTLVATTTPASAYTGLAIGTSASGPTLYAANARNNSVDMFDSNFRLTKSFTDATIPAGFSPYNVQVLDDKLYVTYSKADRTTGAGFGYVDQYDLNGTLLARVGSAGTLNDPWALAIAPKSYGAFAGDLLVGNFGDGTINVFNQTTDQFLGQLAGTDGKPIAITDLWALTPGNGTSAGTTDALYFTAGLADEKHGLFGALTVAPTPMLPPVTN